MNLDDLFDLDALGEEVANGRIVFNKHPTLPLTILKYSKTCPFTKDPWNWITSNCRGLIYDEETLEVVARGFPKFHNYGQKEAPTWDVSEPVTAYNKMDGSAILVYKYNKSVHCATLGSFISEQAFWAKGILDEKYSDWQEHYLTKTANITPIFELIHPENRIVVDYGDMKDLVLIGGVHVESGEHVGPGSVKNLFRWPGPVTEMFPEMTFGEVISREPRENAEGLVVVSSNSGVMVKLKQKDYIALHKAKFGLSTKRIWELVVQGLTLKDILPLFPDEFASWITEKYEHVYLLGAVPVIEALALYDSIREEYGDLDKKAFAEQALKFPKHQGFLFMKYNNVPVPQIYLSSFKKHKPKHEPMKGNFNA